ncbi:MAG: type II CRISPR-associated endonuclease Cas1 [Defluviitaleaceae bacterium]|nr:type II CRISPR-associated endonuclease Cas1 [Defluviitaleaceae bacterium]
MAYRHVIVESEAKLSLKNNQLCVNTFHGDGTVPIEDVSTLLIENRRSVISAAALAALARSGSAVFICDEFHMPCAVLTPFSQHSRQLEITKKQLALSVPVKKQLWKQMVVAKISNQAKCLSLCPHAESANEVTEKLKSISKQVRSGDEGNSEGHAAAIYFSALFGSKFSRSDELDPRNAWLNYGYAILRGCIARSLCVYGFFPAFGIWHHSALNQFNLADDFIEPFRPVVDLFTAQFSPQELSPQNKRQLTNLLNYDVRISKNMYALSYAVERAVQSFSAVCTGKRKDLLLPEIVPLKQHSYE